MPQIKVEGASCQAREVQGPLVQITHSDKSIAKDIWEALQKKYDIEEAGSKKYAVSNYLKYQMSDDKSVEVQSHELQKTSHEITSEGLTIDEQFQVAVIIDKLTLVNKFYFVY